MEEIKLASEQATHELRHLLITDIEENKMHRQNEVIEMQENKEFRSQQKLASSQTEDWRIRKREQEEGILIKSLGVREAHNF